MAEQEIVYRIKVVSDDTGKLAELTASLAEVNKQKDELNKKIKKGEELTASEKEQFAALTAQQKSYQQEIRKTTQEIEKGVKANKLSSDSLGNMRLELSKMRAEFEKLNPATAASKKMASEIGNLQKKINDADFSTKNFRGNVGNYKNAITEALGQTGLMSSGVGQMASMFGAAIPVVGGLGAAAGLLSQYFSSNEERADQLQISMSVLSGAMNDASAGINEFIDTMSGGEGGLAGMITSVTRAIESQLGAWDALGKSYAREAIASRADQISDNARAWQVENAQIEKQISMLKLMAADQGISDERRASYLRQAQELEQKIGKQRLAQAIQELNIIEAKRSIEENTQELNDAYYQAKAKVILIQKEELDSQIKLQSKASGLEEKSAKSEADKTVSLAKQNAEREKTLKMLSEMDNFTEEAPVLRRTGITTEDEASKAQTANMVEVTDNLRIQLDERTQLELKAAEAAIEYDKFVTETKKKNAEDASNALSNTLGNMAGLFEESTTEYKFFASAQAIVDTYKAANLALSSAPPPFNFILMASTIAAGLVNVAKINSTSTKKAADGAYLEGASHAQGGIMIEAEGGEAIINKRSTAKYLPLLSRINTEFGGVPFAERGMYVPTMPDFGGISGAKYQDMLGQQLNDMYSKITQIPVTVLEKDITSTQRRAMVAQSQGNA